MCTARAAARVALSFAAGIASLADAGQPKPHGAAARAGALFPVPLLSCQGSAALASPIAVHHDHYGYRE